ncbi:TOBE domain-containing protein [Desulfovibrio psychrotolerans]|uniref:Integrase n=1 Tax=Desulfovibrio psychrotolerans TaxID=415242 RepID=A0A7J0BYG2_9BACT|nr:TOBE domain-containing protein [Desulfovibrio psychrotolerans]GFM38235.1 integrase [Desulfovibrio psychrotolerans]
MKDKYTPHESEEGQGLDTAQLGLLEEEFWRWAQHAVRNDVRYSRLRVLLVFLVIRYTGAKLSEVLGMNPRKDLDCSRQVAVFRNGDPAEYGAAVAEDADSLKLVVREVQVSEKLCGGVRSVAEAMESFGGLPESLSMDPGFVRRKFYERASACGFSKEAGGPEMIRRARAMELKQGNVPLAAVQAMLGHSSPNLTSAYVSFSDEEIRLATRRYLEKESGRGTSARNSFYGRVGTIVRGDIQSRVEVVTPEGHNVVSVITNDSLDRLGLYPGVMLVAEVKAPWLIVQRSDSPPVSSAENSMHGTVVRLSSGAVNTEYVIRVSESTELCAVVSSGGAERLGLNEGDPAWVLFSSYAVVLHLD